MNNKNDSDLKPGEEILPDMEKAEKDIEPPAVEDAKSVSGHMPTPRADDTIDKQTDEVGLYTEEGEKPKEVDVAEEVKEAEESRRDTEDINLGPAVK